MLTKEFHDLSPKDYILIKGARVHNLKNLCIAIPKNRLVVITGLSGSGKSSLAFDTLYADGQRRYIESLSSYARQFLGRMSKPEVDSIEGIAPAIAIEQKVNTRNPRSTVGTSTEIYDYLKLLYARTGETFSPVSGKKVERHAATDVADYLSTLAAGTEALLYTRPEIPKDRSHKETLQLLLSQGFSRILLNGLPVKIEDALQKENLQGQEFYLVIDRIAVNHDDPDFFARASDSAQTAFFEGKGTCFVRTGKANPSNDLVFSSRFEADGMEFEEPSVNLFSFNNPYGACKKCEGFGSIIGIDPDLVIPNKSLSVYEEAIACWKGEKMVEWKNQLAMNAYKFDFPIHKPVSELTPEQLSVLWTGNEYFSGLNDFFRMVEENAYKIQYRVMLSRYRGKTLCPDCNGTRLRKDAAYVKIAGKSLSELVTMPVNTLATFFDDLTLNTYQKRVAGRILVEISARLGYLQDVGLGYLTLNRLSNTLSGGESQRINLAASLGSSLVGSLYILDEPSIGLHPRDTHKLIGVLQQLRDKGNTVIVVEHDEEIINVADEIIDIGPMAGVHGGQLVFQGNHAKMISEGTTLTADYLTGRKTIPIPEKRRSWKEFIGISGARENNLKNLSVKFPLNVLTVVTGISGSGKTSLVRNILYSSLKRLYGGFGGRSAKFDKAFGDTGRITQVELVDQNPIGRSSRSNPATYVKAYDDIRTLFASQQISKIRGYKPGFFSFNVEGGRCEECEGEGQVKIEMQFMADIFLTCEACGGNRFKAEVMDVTYRGKTIVDILDMTINQAITFFGSDKKETGITRKIGEKLKPLQEVGLGYLKLGQPSSTLSGGEAQRVKLAFFLAKGGAEAPTLFIFDEPTTGLHFHDISRLLIALNALIEKGHTIIVIEHNMEVIKCADWLIDLGPEGGDNGGYILYEGIPDGLSAVSESYTAKYLAKKLAPESTGEPSS